ncbi:unnamed protein product, partial [Nezara viridula]
MSSSVFQEYSTLLSVLREVSDHDNGRESGRHLQHRVPDIANDLWERRRVPAPSSRIPWYSFGSEESDVVGRGIRAEALHYLEVKLL